MNKYLKKIALIVLSNRLNIHRRISAIHDENLLTILNLHMVSDNEGDSSESFSPELFEELLLFIKANFFMTTFSGTREQHGFRNNSKPKLILSFDDGFKDFIDIAMPILEKYKIKANQNIIPSCVETGLPPLNVIAQDFISKAPEELIGRLEIPGFKLKLRNIDRVKLGLQVSRFLKSRKISEQNELREDLLPQFFAWDKFSTIPMMNIHEVKECATVHELGAHSFDHASMEYEDEEYLQNDLVRCKDYFSEVIGIPALIYVFPNGSCREEQIHRPLGLGYEHVLLVSNSFSRVGNKIHDRFGFHASSKKEVFFRAVGGLSKIECCTA
jgi:peptidoglycan/xylan/chitin deacetylase (PgdA/CDA1 family)